MDNKTVTQLLDPTSEGIAQAAAFLRTGACVAFPTETVYGLGADACEDTAVAGIYAAKGRPSFNPLIVHVDSIETALTIVDMPVPLQALAETFWPGPLTLVARQAKGATISGLVTAGLGTVAVRVPAHPVARALLAEFGGPVAAPSANRSGHMSPTTAEHVRASLNGRISAIVDGGACPVGLESTIVGWQDGAMVLLRPGGVTVDAIEAATGQIILRNTEAAITAPGQLASHYAPNAGVRLNVLNPETGEAYLAFDRPTGHPHERVLAPSGSLTEAAANLFARLHELDRMVADRRLAGIAIAPVPHAGLGHAINDRLERAAAPRDVAQA